jgi:hypothetical protein
MLRILLCIAMLCWPTVGYGNNAGKENLVKAVVLYNFAKFTDWPEETFTGPAAPIFFSATGKDMSETLFKLEGKQVKKRDVKLRHFDTNPQYYSHILFISSSEGKSAAKILSGIDNKPILTVSDIPGFIHQGGMIGLIKKDGRIRFEINFDATRKAGLRISSQLLLLATTVIRDQVEVR